MHRPQDPMTNQLPPVPRRSGRPSKKFQFRTTEPSVCTYIARVVILHHMDFELAVQAIESRLSDDEVRAISSDLEASPQVREAIEKQLTAKGLDENSKKIFVEELWNRFWNGDKNQQVTATRILGRAFIAEKVDMNKPEELPIKDFGTGVASMLGKPTLSLDDDDAIDSSEVN